ncbi:MULTISPECIES: hypothetical protein [Bacillus amyloliquefaciens group]|uniref:ABC transporter permease n=1 Tax=Bacillus amyloliquefaciens TaxID=1390 RepID=A0AAP4DHT2_BACAM|nr:MULTISPECIES: hypothetical protein [Bacillus amyloliquefaciens group]ERH54771.1 hypothetical protein O205_10045 [Bacillus amyloliquefaciens EGD-AQ14]MDF4193556.1 ABC transporter permease [Bacillus amyloliquefaciens]MDF4212508.1 ABC transporter permease [Bacillus amyloliquefaciens]MDH3074153.1 ABC transporter permease [Bacillus velezensis]MDH3105773.1 ABC transporter permease [Bacillus velezensis]
MNQLLIELKESLAKQKVFSILILVLGCLFFLLISVLFLQVSNIDTKTKSFYAQLKGKNIYQLSDTLFDEKEEKYFSNPKDLLKLKRFYGELIRNDNFKYLNTTLQPIGVKNFKGDATFLDGYEYGSTEEPYSKDKEMGKYQLVKSVQLNDKVFSVANLKMKKGSFFSKKDYIYTKERVIPVILGSAYQNIYKVGDSIRLDYIDKTFNGKVIGILDRNSVIPVRDEMEFYIDRYIVFPDMNISETPVSQSELTFQQRHYLQLINGQILTTKDNLQIKKIMNSISNNSNFFEYTVIGANGLGVEMISSMVNQNKELMITVCAVSFFFCIMTIILSISIKWNLNIRKYLLHLISGASINRIFSYIFAEVFLILFVCLTIVFVFMFLVGVMPLYYYLMMICLCIIISVFGLTPLYVKLRKMNFSQVLKGKV